MCLLSSNPTIYAILNKLFLKLRIKLKIQKREYARIYITDKDGWVFFDYGLKKKMLKKSSLFVNITYKVISQKTGEIIISGERK